MGETLPGDRRILNGERLPLALGLSARLLSGMKPCLISAAISPVLSMSPGFDLSTLVSLMGLWAGSL